jgi:phage/plasmid-associated DNA primase
LQTEHLDEIFRWMVQGSVDWYQNGRKLELPKVALAAMGEYLNELDTVARFIDDQCVLEGEANRSDLFMRYESWCEDDCDGGDTVAKAQFYVTLARKGFVQKTVRGTRMFQGIALAEEESMFN